MYVTASGALQETSQILNKTSVAFVLLRRGDSARARPRAPPDFIIQNIQNVDASEQPSKQAMLFVNNAGVAQRMRRNGTSI